MLRGMNALFAADPLLSSDPTALAAQCAAADAYLDPGPPPHCVSNMFRPLNPAPSNPYAPAVPGAAAVATYRANPATGGCPVIDPSTDLCAWGPGADTIACSMLRECDWVLQTATYFGGPGAHFEYALPGGPSGNVDIQVVGGNHPGYVGLPNATNPPSTNPTNVNQQGANPTIASQQPGTIKVSSSSAGGTSAGGSQTQSPATQPAAASGFSPTMLVLIAGAALLLLAGGHHK